MGSTGRRPGAGLSRRLFYLLVLALALPAADASAVLLRAQVVKLDDGDSMVVRNHDGEKIRVRLAGIDAPERFQPFGRRSKQNLAALVKNRQVLVDWYKQDQYGRRIARVSVAGVDVGLAQVQAGMAWHYRAYESEQDPQERLRYRRAEDEARSSRRGLWQDPSPQPPWEYRRIHNRR